MVLCVTGLRKVEEGYKGTKIRRIRKEKQMGKSNEEGENEIEGRNEERRKKEWMK